MLTPQDKRAVARQFGRAAAQYDGAARVQAAIAQTMVARIQALHLPACAQVLEIGCGTGLVTRGGLAALPAGQWLATDIAPTMLTACGAALGRQPRLSLVAMDGEHPAVAPGFDLICSSLALQWFPDPAAALRRWRALLAPGGHLLVATLAAGTFGPWHAALAAAGAAPTGPPYPDQATIQGWLPGARVEREPLDDPYPDARSFLTALRQIGADYSPLHPGIAPLRRAIRALEAAGPVTMRYEVAWIAVNADAVEGI